ncbi:MAG: hypothetical protein LDL41_19970 [Coleofasciculus sp. S288]|nr:hypothetical protein [Coleofasciculus sp. S288]
MKSKEDYTAQTLHGWMYQLVPGCYGHYLEVWNPKGKEYRSPKAFEQYEEALIFAESLITLAFNDSNKAINNEDSVRFAQMMRHLASIDCDDSIYKEWHIKAYEDSDNDWDIYAIDPVIGKAEISLKRQADLQEALA